MTMLPEMIQRFSRLPDALRSTLERSLEIPPGSRLRRSNTLLQLGFDVTGVGASEFPSRLLVQILCEAGIRARYVPISTFSGEVCAPKDTCLVVFSQGLSPNAHLPLRAAGSYEESILFTGEGAVLGDELSSLLEREPVVYRHPPESEGGALLRLLGPPCAALLGLRWAAELIEMRQGSAPSWLPLLAKIPGCYDSSASTELSFEGDPSACVAPGPLVALAPTLMWKWQEALYAPLAPTFDLLAFAHGPLQSIVGKRSLLLTLEQTEGEPLMTSLRRVLDPDHHRVVALRASLPAPLSIFEYDAALSRIALGEMRRRRIDPANWPGKKADKPLYEVGSVRS